MPTSLSFNLDVKIIGLPRETEQFNLDAVVISKGIFDIDHELDIFTKGQFDIDHELEIVRVAGPTGVFRLRRPGIDTLDYTRYVLRIAPITRKFEKSFDFGVSQSSRASVQITNVDEQSSYLSSAGDNFPNTRFIWVYASIRSGWGVKLTTNEEFKFVGKVESLDLAQDRTANYVLIDPLREVIDSKTATAITFDSTLVSTTDLQSLNPIRIIQYLLDDVLTVKIWDFDLGSEVSAVNITSFDTAVDASADIAVNSTTWPAESSIIEMIQGCLKIAGGFLFVNGSGKLTAKVYSPFDLPSTPSTFEGDETKSDRKITNLKLSPTRRLIVNKITWTHGQAETELAPIEDLTSQAKYKESPLELKTGWEVDTAVLQSIADRTLSRFSEPPNRITFSTPNLDSGIGFLSKLGDVIKVSDLAAGIANRNYQVIEKTDDILNRRSDIVADDLQGLDGKFAMLSSEVDEGDGLGITANDFNNWTKAFGFMSDEDGSTNPGFDLDGNANGVIDPGFGLKDDHGNGLEEHFTLW